MELIFYHLILLGNRRHPLSRDIANMSSKVRFEIQIGVSGAEIREEPIGNFRFCVAPQKPIKSCENQIVRPNFRNLPSVPECIQTHPDASEPIRMHPDRSQQVPKHQKTCKNLQKLAKTSRTLRTILFLFKPPPSGKKPSNNNKHFWFLSGGPACAKRVPHTSRTRRNSS